MTTSVYIVRTSKGFDCEHGGDPEDLIITTDLTRAENVFLDEKKKIERLHDADPYDCDYADEVLLLSAVLDTTPVKFTVCQHHYWECKS